MQEFSNPHYPFFPFDPKLFYTGAHRYWVDRLQKLVGCIAELQKDYDGKRAYNWVAKNLAVLELTGYHSQKMNGGLIDKLQSTSVMRGFLKEYVIPRVIKKECIVVLVRSKKMWLDKIPEPNMKFWIDGTNTMCMNGRTSDAVVNRLKKILPSILDATK